MGDDGGAAGSGNSDLEAVLTRLRAELEQQGSERLRSQRIGLAIVVLVGLYLCWVTVQVNRLSDPEEVALAAAGAAMGATPVLGEHLRTVLVEGAPDIARLASSSVVDMIPAYRQVAEAELMPLVDQVSEVLATVALAHMARSLTEGTTPSSEQEALQAAADAAVARFEVVLEEALDEPSENGGPTPRESIAEALSQLRIIDRGLKRVASKGGDPRERELILSWLALIAEQSAVAELSARESYRVGAQRAAERAAAQLPAAGASEPSEATE